MLASFVPYMLFVLEDYSVSFLRSYRKQLFPVPGA